MHRESGRMRDDGVCVRENWRIDVEPGRSEVKTVMESGIVTSTSKRERAQMAETQMAQTPDARGLSGGPESLGSLAGPPEHAPEGSETSMCFACGRDNPWGLKLDFKDEGGRYVAKFTPREEYQGYPGILHGGIVCTLLDESMARMLWSRGMKLPTGRLEVRFKRPARLDAVFRVEAAVLSQEGRVISCSSVLKDIARDEVVAEGKATFLVPSRTSSVSPSVTRNAI